MASNTNTNTDRAIEQLTKQIAELSINLTEKQNYPTPNLFTILIIILVEMNKTITIINEMLLAIIVEVKDTLLKIVAIEKKTIGITLTLTTDIATTLIITLALIMVITQTIESTIIITLMIILDLKKEIDHIITTDHIRILGIIIYLKAK